MLKGIFFWFLMGIIFIFCGCNKFISKKIDKDQVDASGIETAHPSESIDESSLDLNADITGFPNRRQKIYLVASIKKTPCLVECPIFEAKLYSNGKTTFFGRRNVSMQGRYEGQISEKQMQELIAKMEAVNFFNFNSSYPMKLKRRVSEYSKTILIVQIGDKFKKIKINSDPPIVLTEYEQFLSLLFEEVEWSAK